MHELAHTKGNALKNEASSNIANAVQPYVKRVHLSLYQVIFYPIISAIHYTQRSYATVQCAWLFMVKCEKTQSSIIGVKGVSL